MSKRPSKNPRTKDPISIPHQNSSEIVTKPELSPKNVEIRGRMQVHTGPLPDPETLRKYDDLLPGTAERIITMAEREQRHVHETVTRVHVWTLVRKQIGQFSGFLIAIGGLSVGSWLIYKGHDWAGTAIAGIGLSNLVGLFVKEHQSDNKPSPRK
ncbi:MAG: DUF2335 domain-containing protein [Leptospirales bacterium]